MPRIYTPTRITKVPWLWPSDLEEGQPCTYERTFDTSHTSVWRVVVYDKETEEFGLVVQAQRGNGNDGGVITLSIQSIHATETYQPAMNVALLSNPRRDPEEDGS